MIARIGAIQLFVPRGNDFVTRVAQERGDEETAASKSTLPVDVYVPAPQKAQQQRAASDSPGDGFDPNQEQEAQGLAGDLAVATASQPKERKPKKFSFGSDSIQVSHRDRQVKPEVAVVTEEKNAAREAVPVDSEVPWYIAA